MVAAHDDPRRRGEQVARHLADRLMRRPLAHADHDEPLADRHHVATLEGAQTVVGGSSVGLGVVQVLRMLLDTCATAEEAIAKAKAKFLSSTAPTTHCAPKTK